VIKVLANISFSCSNLKINELFLRLTSLQKFMQNRTEGRTIQIQLHYKD